MRRTTAIILIIVLGISAFNPVVLRADTQDELQRQLQEIEREIAEQEVELRKVQGEKQTVQDRLNQLKQEEAALRLKLRRTSLRIDSLDNQIEDTVNSIEKTQQEIEELKPRLAEIIRSIYEQEKQSLIEILVVNDSLSEAMMQIDQLNELSDNMVVLAEDMRDLKSELEDKQVVLEEQHEETKQLLEIQALQKQELDSKVRHQNTILNLAQAQESEYQAVLTATRSKANEIRARLYELAGGGSQNVTFGQAVELAKWASSQTGVRAALLLAVLTQESNLGKNVGTCNRAGDPEWKSWRNIMHPTRDQPKFVIITKELGRDPNITPISCPMFRGGRQIGWGGAMGPAQFIPSTWMGYKDRVAAILGRPADPWNIRDAFLASALLLRDNGATQNGARGEWEAALRYFAGWVNLRFRFYADNVMALANRYQAEIDALN